MQNITLIQTYTMLTVIRKVSGLQELGGKGAVGVFVRLLVPRLPVFPVSASKRPLLGGAGRDLPASALDEQNQQVNKLPQGNHLRKGPKKDNFDLKRPERVGFKKKLPQRLAISACLRVCHRGSKGEHLCILIACLLVHSEETGGILHR